MAGRMPPPRRGRAFYDVDRGERRYQPRRGRQVSLETPEGRAVYDAEHAPAATATRRSRAGRSILRGAGVLADQARDAGSSFAGASDFNFSGAGRFVVAMFAALLGLILLDFLIGPRGSAATGAGFGWAGNAIDALVSPTHPIIARAAGSSSAPSVAPGTPPPAAPATPGAGSGTGLYFPVQTAAASFTNDYGSPTPHGPLNGVVITAPKGSPAVAIAPGTVKQITLSGPGTLDVLLSTSYGDFVYRNLESPGLPTLKKGATVPAGAQLGTVSANGLTLGYAPNGYRGPGDLSNPFDILTHLWKGGTP
jgi:murein DD-endopeptidase MepM/ murein hydrolase activator NlpD